MKESLRLTESRLKTVRSEIKEWHRDYLSSKDEREIEEIGLVYTTLQAEERHLLKLLEILKSEHKWINYKISILKKK